ncbi:OmcA/MtrC family decaheme c-type cytochrome [Shewanella algicola]|uniref:OmcA/MtrC family decaheme c-type cytochrome n=2 Tax=Shewanella algicola TaxID=640633 RepID=A0A9X1Z8V4_9GAMM|nr:OmcA/MtrC family decaheme c-type cytochrome [Shewanella algicola]MCL1106184.1 OmcA/MtrC family decaheme c-type cytochrome [Shewanella algicola]
MKKYNKTLLAAAFIAAFGLAGCGSDGSDGADGVDGVNGVDGTDGSDGANASLSVTTVENAYDYNLTLDPADIVVVGSDPFSIKFTVTGVGTGNAEVPFSGLEKVALYVTSQSENTTDTGAPILWTNHALANDFGSSMYCTPTGTAVARGGAEVEACTLVEDAANPGTYTGTWAHDGNAPVVLADGDANDLVRVMVRTYDVVDADGNGISDKILSTPLDFIPATGELAVSEKDSVSNAACIKCHSSLDGYADTDMRIANIGAHHNYQKVENCVACHNPAYAGGQDDEDVGFNANFNAMIHTIHAGHHIADSLTGEAAEMFGEIGFPAELNECTACHDNGTQWNDNVYEEACVSCHVDVDLATGENHNGIVPSSDAVCSGCHGAGSLSPVEAHSVNRRADLTDGLVLNVVSAEVAAGELTVIIDVELNGAAPIDGTDLTDYLFNASFAKNILMGTLDDNGDYVPGLSVAATVVTGGQLTLTQTLADPTDLDGKTLYVSSEMNMCGDAETDMIVATADGCDVGIPANIETKYFVFGDTAATGDETTDNLRFVNSTDYNAPTQVGNDRTTADEAKCNACHDNMAHIKAPRHGVTNFTQCADCHNNNYPGSYHADVAVESDDGTFVQVEGLHYYNRDLATVAHRYHSGTYAEEASGVYIDKDGELVNYPATKTNCQACHKDANADGDAMPFFDGTGKLTSGRTAIAASDNYGATVEYISPVAEACRSCHAHSGDAALAHFKSNGATVFGDNITSADAVPVESCATCHAEGKTYGLDSVH